LCIFSILLWEDGQNGRRLPLLVIASSMFLDAAKVPEIHRLLTSGRPETVEKLRGAEVSLTVTLFLALALHAARQSGDAALAELIAGLGFPGVAGAKRCLEYRGQRLSPDPFGAPPFDLYRIGSKQELLSPEWSLFYDRFRRSAANGRTSAMFRGVGGVLGEMGDNVVWHAFTAEDKPCPALAGFHITKDAASFCVADLGQGFLRSLQRDVRWRALASDSEALDAVVNKHATSRQGEQAGGGFRQLFNSLLDFNGLVVLRSGSCTYRLENCGDARQVTVRESSATVGSSVTVVISLRDKPLEKPLEKA
jgi:hypothetical protein